MFELSAEMAVRNPANAMNRPDTHSAFTAVSK